MLLIHSLGGGGAERVAADLSAAWVARGYRVSLVTQAGENKDVYALASGVERHVLGTAGASRGRWQALWNNWRRVRRLRALLRRHKPDVLLGMMTTSSVLAVSAAKGLPCKVIATEHTHPPSQSISSFWQKARVRTYPQAQAVVALTAGTADWLREHVPGSQVQVIPNAVRWPMENGEPVVPVPALDGRRRLLAVGRLHPVKGFDSLIDAFAMLSSYFPNWDLVILGEGEQREALQERIADLNLQERIQMPGRVGNMADWYGQSDLYVLSSRMEGLSNSLLEAMASGLTAVAYDCDTGPREIIRANIDGVLVQPVSDVEALAAHLSDLMANPDKRQRLARRAIDVRDRFSSARVLALWQQLLEQCLRRS
ncbi:glycosyltransferase family 4 protein [Alcaligenes sp. SDU_A2]|uniref:glycosyltransferase family 4 protein n=1 Tax=Alcaligenes sp. SDU_A2 TaxID=3136634 RepID=UPI00311D8EAB